MLFDTELMILLAERTILVHSLKIRIHPQPKMAAEVDFGDLELFEAFDHPEDSTPKPIHTRFKDDDDDGDGDEEDENGTGDAELREWIRQCEETIQQLRVRIKNLKEN